MVRRAEEILRAYRRAGIDPAKVFVDDPRARPSPAIQQCIDAVRIFKNTGVLPPNVLRPDEEEALRKIGPDEYLAELEKEQQAFTRRHRH